MCSISLSVDKTIPGYLMHACKCSFIRALEQMEVQGNLSETLDGVFNRVVTLRLESARVRWRLYREFYSVHWKSYGFAHSVI